MSTGTGPAIDTPAARTLLTIDEAAAQLAIPPVGVLRLISRGRLKATRTRATEQADGVWRVASEDLTAYVRAGAPDVTPRPVGDDGWIDDHRDRWLARRFEEELVKASSPQRINDARVAELEKSNQLADFFDVLLSISPAMREIIEGPPQFMPAPKAPPVRYSSWGQLFLVSTLLSQGRVATADADRKRMKPSLVHRLYDSPQQHSEIIAETVRRTIQRNVAVWSEFRPRQIARPSAVADGGLRITYLLPMRRLTTEGELRQLCDKFAF